jgi:hypothetical protein
MRSFDRRVGLIGAPNSWFAVRRPAAFAIVSILSAR